MNNPAADFPDDRARWLIEALSIGSSEAALAHLARGWRQFTDAEAVFLCHLTPARTRGTFLRETKSSQQFDDPDVSADRPGDTQTVLEAALASIESRLFSELPVDGLTLHPTISLIDHDKPVGGVWLWSGGAETPTGFDWLQEASARLLSNLTNIEAQLLADKLDALGEFAAGAGHEINNPVASISGRARQLLLRETDPERRRQLLTIGGQALRIRDMIGDAMLFARPPEPDPERLELSELLPEILSPLEEDFKQAGADFACDLADGACLFADKTQLAVVITELLRNSLGCLGENGRIHLKIEAVDSPDGVMTHIAIEDDGQSFTDEELAHAFDPFYSGRQAGRGLGFGLPKCWRIVSNHHGKIHIARLGEQGTRVTVIWPAYDFRDSETS